MQQSIVRLSRGRFEPDQYEVIRQRLDESAQTLVPAIRALRGCRHFWAGIERASATMINVSVWESLEAARQMDTLAPMLTLAREFTSLGVTFERPIINYETLWTL